MTDLRTIEEAAEQLRRPVATMYDWRYRKVGPPSAKIGGRVMYRQADLDSWVEAQFEQEATGATA